MPRPSVAFLYHAGSSLDQQVLLPWLARWAELKLIIRVQGNGGVSVLRRLRFERRRSGWAGLLDVLLFRCWYRLTRAKTDKKRIDAAIASAAARFGPVPVDLEVVDCTDPNGHDVTQALQRSRPDLMLARSKVLLAPHVYERTGHGTLVMHPGICPEYRNSHGCFWAQVAGDYDNIGVTVLQIDEGIDTGPILLEVRAGSERKLESHAVLQTELILDNLDTIAMAMTEFVEGKRTTHRRSLSGTAPRGQPRLSSYLRWRRRCRRQVR